MSNLVLHWTPEELLAGHDVAEPVIARGVRCHGGYDEAGSYRPPRTLHRVPAIAAWQQHHRETFASEILDPPLDAWPEPYPNVAQAKYLIREGVPGPIITTLTRVGTVEGFGGLIRHVAVDDLQRHVADSIDGTCAAHLDRGLFEAQARDEAGWEAEAGHSHMWFVARDVAFGDPPTEDETERMLSRMGIVPPPAGDAPRPRPVEERLVEEIDPQVEWMLRRMVSLLFIEVSAFHTFAWAEEILADTDLVEGDGRAAELVRCIRADETPHVDYLRTALTELRDRSFVGTSGRRIAGQDVIGRLWDHHLADSLGPRRDEFLRASLAEVEHAVAGDRRRAELLEGFHAAGTLRPDATGRLAPAAA